jgi:hypothetical protein
MIQSSRAARFSWWVVALMLLARTSAAQSPSPDPSSSAADPTAPPAAAVPAAVPEPGPAPPEASPPGQTDVAPEVDLPEYVSRKKRMSGADLTKKREGVFPTGLPFFSSDPLNGVGGGVTGYLHFNGSRSDPLFAYTPYNARVGFTGQYTTGNAAALSIKVDVPFLAGTAWRLKADGKYESSPNNLYFGLTEDTLRPLPQGRYSDYAAALKVARPGGAGEAPLVADSLRHYFLEKEWMLNLKAERLLFDGNWRVLVGYEIQHLRYDTFEGKEIDAIDPATGATIRVPNGKSLLREDSEQGRALGLRGGRVSLVQLSLMYDTRDFEPDPRRGVFVELATESSSKVIGSEFTFVKALVQARHFWPILPSVFSRLVLASRVGYGTIFSRDAPFFEFQDQWSAEGSVRALGGSQTLRGYKANRFLGRTVGFVNVELRYRFADFDLLTQNFTLTAAPFLDLGTIGDRIFVVAPELRAAGGAGLRIGWNRSTVIVLDGAFSEEDRQFFLSFNSSY